MEKTFNNRELKSMIRTAGCGEDMLFYAKDVAGSLGYLDPQKAIRTHVWSKNRTTIGELKGVPKTPSPCSRQPGTVPMITLRSSLI